MRMIDNINLKYPPIESLFAEKFDYNSITMKSDYKILHRLVLPLYDGEDSIDSAINYAINRMNYAVHRTLLQFLTNGTIYSGKFDSMDMIEYHTRNTFNLFEDVNIDDVLIISNRHTSCILMQNYGIDEDKIRYNEEWPDNIITVIPNTYIVGTLFYGISPLKADIMSGNTKDMGSTKSIDIGYYNNTLYAQTLFSLNLRDTYYSNKCGVYKI